MVQPAADDLEVRTSTAIARCQEQIQWYEKQKGRQRALYYTFQSLVVVLSGITPILILWTGLPKPIQALPAALGSIAAGLAGSFHWLEGWTRFAIADESLKSELAKFRARASESYSTKVSDEQALENFVTRVEAIVLAETTRWGTEIVTRGTHGKE